MNGLSWEIFPFSFKEYLDWKGIEIDGQLSTKRRLFIQKAFDEYWEWGTFPETVGLGSYLRIKAHQEYFHSILYHDLIERYDISRPKLLIDLATWLINNAASLYTVNSLTGYLKSLEHKVSKSSVAEFLDWFEDAYFLFTTGIFDSSLARDSVNPKKIYCIDHALISSVLSGILINSGHRLENLILIVAQKPLSL
ncbi:MAG: hypothetical protein LBV23_04145 [Deltaproteobacteria bacterium]|nr:hypothetical protein [Deltaproteobacteria bacterium]